MVIKKSSFVAVIAMFILLATHQISAQGRQYRVNYSAPGWKWASSSVTYRINTNLTTPFATQQQYEDAIQNAVGQWNGAGSKFHFNKGDNVSYLKGSEPSDVFQVGWYAENDGNHAITIVDHPNGVITKVATYFNQMYIFAAEPNSYQVDVLSTILHELGHWLYLDDETDAASSQHVMY